MPPPHHFVYSLRVFKDRTSLDDVYDQSAETVIVEDVDHERIA